MFLCFAKIGVLPKFLIYLFEVAFPLGRNEGFCFLPSLWTLAFAIGESSGQRYLVRGDPWRSLGISTTLKF
jgi:hypothetical protein